MYFARLFVDVHYTRNKYKQSMYKTIMSMAFGPGFNSRRLHHFYKGTVMLIFDIDGVVADIEKYCAVNICQHAKCELHDVDFSRHDIKLPVHVEPELIVHWATQATVKYKKSIRPFTGAIEFLQEYADNCLRGHPLTFLTARVGPNVKEATYWWLEKHLQTSNFVVHFDPRKYRFLRQHTQYTGIVEDRFKTANELDFMRYVFLINRIYNAGRTEEPHVTRINALSDVWKHPAFCKGVANV